MKPCTTLRTAPSATARPELPVATYLRRGVVRAYLGISDEVFTRLLTAGVLRPYYAQPGGRAFFSRAEILDAVASGRLFRVSEAADTPVKPSACSAQTARQPAPARV